jgi:hypothetical protein
MWGKIGDFFKGAAQGAAKIFGGGGPLVEAKALENLQQVDVHALRDLQRIVGVESGGFQTTGTANVAVDVQAKASAVIKVLEQCKKMGVIEPGAFRADARVLDKCRKMGIIENGAVSAKVCTALESIKGIDAAALERIVGVDASSLEKIMETGVDSRYARLMTVFESAQSVFPSLTEMFVNKTVTIGGGSTAVAFAALLFTNMESEHKVDVVVSFVWISFLVVVLIGAMWVAIYILFFSGDDEGSKLIATVTPSAVTENIAAPIPSPQKAKVSMTGYQYFCT